MAQVEKTKLLLWGDYCCATGFAQVLGNIARELDKTGKYDIDVLAINYSGDPVDSKKWPGQIWPAMPGGMMEAGPYRDVYGRQRLLDLMGSGRYDVVYMIQDTFIVEPILKEINKTLEALVQHGHKTFKTVYYFPVDAALKEEWAKVAMSLDFPVVYTEYGKKEVLKHVPDAEDRLEVIYHGNNPDDFFPIQDKEDVKKFKKMYFNDQAENRFVITNINRNQPRKDITRSLMILKELWDRGRDPLMYFHMQYEDAGGNIFSIAKQLGLGQKFEFFLPSPKIFNANQGMPVEDVNRIYNASDMVLSTTLGEGWGLSITEAMATKTPIVAPNNTSLTEMMAKNRGKLIESGANPSMFFCQGPADNDRIRPVMSVEKAADAIEDIMDGKNLPNLEAAYLWVRDLDWQNITRQWIRVIDKAADAAKQENYGFKKKALKPLETDPGQIAMMSRAQRRRLEREQRKKDKKNANL